MVFPLLLGLGTWQIQRAEDKHQLMLDRESRKFSEAVDLNKVTEVTEADRHKPARVSGRYLNRPQWLLDNRLYNGRPGYHVFSVLEVDNPERSKLVVNRGWVSIGRDRTFLPDVPVPEQKVELTGRLDSPASVAIVLEKGPLNMLSPVSVVQNLDLGAVEMGLGEAVPTYALVLDEGQAGLLQRDWRPAKTITPEKHLGYAVQWYALAMALLFIYVGVNTRRLQKGKQDES